MLKFIHSMKNEYGETVSKGISAYNEKMPNFSRINLANGELNGNSRFVNSIRNEVTQEELNNKYKWRKIKWQTIQKLENNELLKDELTKTHNLKLEKIGIKPFANINEKNITKRTNNDEMIEKTKTADAIFNLSSRVLSPTEETLLRKGLKFGIKNTKVDQYEIFARFEDLAQSLDRMEIAEKGDELRANLNSKNAFFQQLQIMSNEFIELSKKSLDNLTDEEHKARKDLANDEKDLTKTREASLQKYLKKLNTKSYNWIEDISITDGPRPGFRKVLSENYISDGVLRRITPCGSRSGVIYGLPKIHKEGASIRPIISAIGKYNYKLANYLDEILKPLLDGNEYILKDTFDFVNQVSKLEPNGDSEILSFDVESLFTNVLTFETIEQILNLAYKDGKSIFH
ncbi:unnamed protein product [Brachionus calyciflorus]|uniref:Reverse transcriptase domain-containing protein n=1 Tax=Brachionus calyciflorus TaxID=104777 RepID=A0A814BIM9_9BILA|nr:unnamed protein product [Brachionus calyciflorus]